MKRTITIILALCLLLSLCACGRKRKEETGLLRIGVLEPMTGEYGEAGTREALGIQYANAETQSIQLGGKTYRIELVLRDNGSDAAQAAQAARELVEAGCAVVLGSYGAELSAAASDVFRAAGVPAIAASCDDAAVTTGNDHYFRIGALPELQGSVLASFAKNNLGVKSAYCIVEAGNAEDELLLRAFREAAERLELKVIATAFAPNNTDFSIYLNAAAEEKAGVIVAPCALRYAQPLAEQADGETPPILADGRWRDDALLAALSETELQVYVTAAFVEGADSGFDAGFKDWVNGNEEALARNGGSDAISAESALGYDAYCTALAAAKAANSADKADILAILPSISRTGVTGAYSFDADGGAVRSAMWIVKPDVKTGLWETVSAAKTEK